jgi:hypothetical protein
MMEFGPLLLMLVVLDWVSRPRRIAVYAVVAALVATAYAAIGVAHHLPGLAKAVSAGDPASAWVVAIGLYSLAIGCPMLTISASRSFISAHRAASA